MGNLENVSLEYPREVWEKVEKPKAVRRLSPVSIYKEMVEETLQEPPEEVGLDALPWTVPLAR